MLPLNCSILSRRRYGICIEQDSSSSFASLFFFLQTIINLFPAILFVVGALASCVFSPCPAPLAVDFNFVSAWICTELGGISFCILHVCIPTRALAFSHNRNEMEVRYHLLTVPSSVSAPAFVRALDWFSCERNLTLPCEISEAI